MFRVFLLCFLAMPFALTAQWSLDPVENLPLATGTNDQTNPRVCATADGYYVVVWEEEIGSDMAIYAQRLDKSGYACWPTGGVVVNNQVGVQRRPAVAPDGMGGVFVVWEDFRSGVEDIYAQHLDADGNLLWDPSGVPISTAPYSQNFPAIAADGNGGAFIAFESKQVDGVHPDIYVQHLQADGTISFAANGLAICSAAWGQRYPQIVSNAPGNAVVAWVDSRADYPYYPDIYAQKVSSDGTIHWQADGIPVCAETGEQEDAAMASDASGSVYIAWRDKRSGESDIYVQKILPDGNAAWILNGQAICTAVQSQYRPRVVPDGNGGCIVSWFDYRKGNTFPFDIDVFAQRVGLSGNVLWQVNGVPVGDTPSNQIDHEMIPDGSGGAIVVWLEHPNNGITDVYAQRIDSTGSREWLSNGVAVSVAGGSQRQLSLVSDGYGGAVAVWSDERDYQNSGGDIYAHYLNHKGKYSNALPGLKIHEIYYCGPVNNVYFFFDQYVELVNSSDSVVYLDGKIIARVRTSGVQLAVADTLDAVYAYQFPGSPGGTFYPVAPGEYVLIAVDAYDHSQTLPNAINLEMAPWEFYNQFGNDSDNPSAANLININPNRPQDFLMNLVDDYIVLTDGSAHWQNGNYVTIPVETVLDGVEYHNDSTDVKRGHLIVDVGFAGVGIERYSGKSIQRKPQWQDTNHSTKDFEVLTSPTPEFPTALPSREKILTGSFQLFQNYPNPFNPNTTIVYSLPVSGQVKLTVYNTLGQKIKTLMQERQLAGRYELIWDGRDENGQSVASGVYLLQLSIRGNRFQDLLTRKMVLMR